MLSAIAFLVTAVLVVSVQGTYVPTNNAQSPMDVTFDEVKVPVTLGVMSACPDALACEAVFDHVLKNVGPKVDLGLTFVAK